MAARKKRRKYRVRCHSPLWKTLVGVVLVIVLILGLMKLISYGIDLISSRHTSDELQAIYYSVPSDEPIMITPESTVIPPPISTPKETALPIPSPASTQSPIPKLESMGYPYNAKLQISSRFKALRKKSKYIVGWLSINKMLEEAVAQRNNEYYLDHDALGNSNANGALFLDSAISLKTRPYTYIIYGHNMKSGAMFGSLRNYENITYYHNDPIVTFDTMYESGRYVIFAVGTISTEENGENYVDFFALRSANIQERQEMIDTLINASVHTCPVDVRMDDQLLVLVTCVEKDEDRRVVVARRIRDGEDETELKKQVQKSQKR